jgi:hypothetical protein
MEQPFLTSYNVNRMWSIVKVVETWISPLISTELGYKRDNIPLNYRLKVVWKKCVYLYSGHNFHLMPLFLQADLHHSAANSKQSLLV